MPNSAVRTFGARRSLALAFALALIADAGAAESGGAFGTIFGRVISLESGEGVPGAVVSVQGTTRAATTGLNGDYTLSSVPVGSHMLRVEREEFQSSTVNNVNVSPGGATRSDLPMEAVSANVGGEMVEMAEFVISADVVEGSNLALLGARQRSAVVSDAVGSDFLGRVDADDAADAMSRVTGASVLDGKYVLIRGLGDRYSNTLLNGANIPSADPDRRAVQMDQYPAGLLDAIITSKSFTPDQPGGFAGGSVNMKTKNFPETFFFSTSASIGFNTNATGEDLLSVPGGGRDWLGMDDGTRTLPEGIPSRIPSQTEARIAARNGDFGPAEELDRASKLFNNESYFPETESGRPDLGFNFATGDRFSFGEDQVLGYVVSLSYDRSSSYYENGYAARYAQGGVDPDSPAFIDGLLVYSPDLEDLGFKNAYEANPEIPDGVPRFGVTSSSQNVDWSGYAQLAYRPSLNHEVALRFIRSQSAGDAIKRGVGESARSDAGRLYQIYDLLYTERSVNSLQLEGSSLFPEWNETRVEWRASTGTSTQEQPDYRTLSYFWDFANQDYAAAAGVGNNRFFRDLEEDGDELAIDTSVPFEFRGRNATFKFGGAWQGGDRTYRERRFRWSREATDADIIRSHPGPVGIVDRTADSVTFGNTIAELPNNLVNYDGAQTISAAYIMAELSATDRLRVITGVRAEKTGITTRSLSTNTSFRPADIDDTDYLPALSLVYDLGNDMNLRFAYGRTLARPLYHELADIRVEDAFRGKFRAGNPDLELSGIDNLDLRWEWFPSGSEVVAVSLFHKDFTNPIEVVDVPSIGSEQAQNADSGEVYGIEFEARLGLGRFSDRLAAFSFGGNLSLVESEVSVPQAEMDSIRMAHPEAGGTRDLLGQSPYIFNLDFSYDDIGRGTSATIAYNIQGRRLHLVTYGALPDIFEQPAPQLDFIFSQRISRNLRLKFAAKNLLDPDFDKSFTHNGREYFYERYTRGRAFSLGLSYSFE
ncbi:MAG: TonB-dependent receptor domain-containing protein [Opitutaceae bacterium]